MSRGFDDAVNTSNDMMVAAIAKQLEPVYCTRCGSRLQVRSVRHKGFDKETGYPKYDVILGCRHVTLYKTDILGQVGFTWKAPFGRHSVHRVSRIIEQDTDLADSHYKRGDAYHNIDDYRTAIANYDLAIKLNPNHALAYYNRGLAYHTKGNMSRAVDDLEKCAGLSTNPELTKAAQRALRKLKGSS